MQKSFTTLLIALLVRTIFAADASDPTVGRWTMSGNGPGHTGFYPATLNTVQFAVGWSKSFDGLPINQVAVSDGRVFLTSTGYTAGGNGAVSFAAALDSATGDELWRSPAGSFPGAPIVSENQFFFKAESKLYALRALDGSVEWMRDQHTAVGIFTLWGDRIWTGNSGSVSGFRLSDNSQRFSAALSQIYGCRHSYYAGVVYVSESGIFRALDAETGVRLWTLHLPFQGTISQEDNVPAVMNGRASVVTTGQGLTTVDLKTKSILWSVAGNFFRAPATDGTTVYAIQAGAIYAYAADTGELRGRYDFSAVGGGLVPRGAQPLVTNDMVMIGADRGTYIFDKASFEPLGGLPTGGYLSLAAGVLYIADLAGNLETYTFRDAPAEPAPAPWPSPTPSATPTPPASVALVSINHQGTSTGNRGSSAGSISRANGRYLLFGGLASDITPLSDTNGFGDLFLRDLQAGTTELVTVNWAGTEAGKPFAAPGDGGPSLTPDGRFVAFASPQYDLVPADTDVTTDVFVRDMRARQTIAVSVDRNGSPAGGTRPFISDNGRWVMFTSSAGNLADSPGVPGSSAVYVRDLETGQTVRVSVDETGEPMEAAGGRVFTKNGRFVVFNSQLDSGAQNRNQLYLRDLQAQTTQLITITPSGTQSTNGQFQGKILVSDDGRFVVFESSSTDLVDGDPNGSRDDIFVRDTVAGTTLRIDTEENGHAVLGDMSADGMVIGFFVNRSTGSGTGTTYVYIWDRRAGIKRQLIAGGASSNNALGTTGMEMDPTGRLVLFESGESSSFGINLGSSSAGNVYLADRQLGTIRLISHDLAGNGSGNSGSAIAGMTDDGQTIAFNSLATNLVALPDANNTSSHLESDTFVSTLEASGVLLNIATRGLVQADEKALIGGFVLSGASPRKIMIRAIGPSLRTVGISGVLADPTLELYDQSGALIARSDNWKENQMEIEKTGIQPSDDLEPALVQTLHPGAYTGIVRGKDGSAGVGLVELYDLEQSADARLANISTRGMVETGDNVMIAGFIAGGGGGGASRVLVRALGPTLSNFGVAGALQNPVLELRDPNGLLVASNDDWKTAERTEIEAAGLAPAHDAESAIIKKLAAGPYTAIIRGANNSTGVGLVEVYNVP